MWRLEKILCGRNLASQTEAFLSWLSMMSQDEDPASEEAASNMGPVWIKMGSQYLNQVE